MVGSCLCFVLQLVCLLDPLIQIAEITKPPWLCRCAAHVPVCLLCFVDWLAVITHPRWTLVPWCTWSVGLRGLGWSERSLRPKMEKKRRKK